MRFRMVGEQKKWRTKPHLSAAALAKVEGFTLRGRQPFLHIFTKKTRSLACEVSSLPGIPFSSRRTPGEPLRLSRTSRTCRTGRTCLIFTFPPSSGDRKKLSPKTRRPFQDFCYTVIPSPVGFKMFFRIFQVQGWIYDLKKFCDGDIFSESGFQNKEERKAHQKLRKLKLHN